MELFFLLFWPGVEIRSIFRLFNRKKGTKANFSLIASRSHLWRNSRIVTLNYVPFVSQ